MKIKFLKSLAPYRKGDIVDFAEERYTDFLKKHTEIVEEKPKAKKTKSKNKAILETNND